MLQCRVGRNASEEVAPRDDVTNLPVVLQASVSFLPWVRIRMRQAHLSAALGSVRALTSCERCNGRCHVNNGTCNGKCNGGSLDVLRAWVSIV